MSEEPQTLIEAVRHFADPDVALNTMVSLRWPTGVCCPTCGRADVRFVKTRRIWECKEVHAKRQFTAKVGTIFEDSPLGLDKWFVAIWMVANCKNGVSSYELHRALGVTQKTAWFILHRIRLAMQAGSLMTAEGTAEADETLVGGRNSTSRVRARVIRETTRSVLHTEVRAAVAPGSILMTDARAGYQGLGADFKHEVVDHAVAYVHGHVHTNGIENFWSLLKRGLKGTYVSVEPFHLFRYLDEQVFRFNERAKNDYGRFEAVLSWVNGLRLTYSELTGNDREATA